jgi:4-hydroxybenzoate polyprenyltransferase
MFRYWLQLMRWRNLLIVLATQFTAWFCVIRPAGPEFLSTSGFLLLAFSTVCIAAAGYIINDYFDIRIDAINKPDKLVLGRIIPRRTAIIVHSVLNLAGMAAALLLAYTEHAIWLAGIQLVCTFLLWLYSSRFKRAFVIGNVVVSLLTALTIITPICYEPAIWHLAPFTRPGITPAASPFPFWILLSYAWFAFILNWMREIVKDMEDFTGDINEGCRTMPILRGMTFSAYFTNVLALFAVVPLSVGSAILWQKQHYLFSGYLAVFLVIPLCTWSFYLHKSFTVNHYSQASRLLKLIMIPGIFSLFIYFLQL